MANGDKKGGSTAPVTLTEIEGELEEPKALPQKEGYRVVDRNKGAREIAYRTLVTAGLTEKDPILNVIKAQAPIEWGYEKEASESDEARTNRVLNAVHSLASALPDEEMNKIYGAIAPTLKGEWEYGPNRLKDGSIQKTPLYQGKDRSKPHYDPSKAGQPIPKARTVYRFIQKAGTEAKPSTIDGLKRAIQSKEDAKI